MPSAAPSWQGGGSSDSERRPAPNPPLALGAWPSWHWGRPMGGVLVPGERKVAKPVSLPKAAISQPINRLARAKPVGLAE